LGKWLKKLKMPMAQTKMKMFKKKFLPNFQTKFFSPETVERILKSCKKFWNIFGGRG
jgi:hypothetical protein